MKKVLSLITAVIMILSLCAVSSVRVSALQSNGFTYTVSGTKAVITGYTGSSTAVTIPSKIGSYTVSNIGGYAFFENTKIKSVTVPSTVTSISNCAFAGCTALTSVTLKSGLKTISTGAFQNCKKITSISLPSSVKTINANAFAGCSALTEITLPLNLTEINSGLFDGCSALSVITIGAGVEKIASDAFENCKSLAKFVVDSANTNFTTRSGVLYSKNKTVLVAYPVAKTSTSYSVPTGTVQICDRAFYNAVNLNQIVLPESVMKIGRDAFYGTALYNNSSNWENGHLVISSCLVKSKTTDTDITISGIRVIADSAFENCKSLKTVTLGKALKGMGNGVFAGCSNLYKLAVAVASGTYSSAKGVMYNEARTEIVAYPMAKEDTHFTVPDTVQRINDFAFMGAKNLKTITIPKAVTSIGDYAFFSSSIEAVRLQSATVGKYAFAYCNQLDSLRLSKAVKNIGARAFYNCDALKAIYIEGNGLESIGDYAIGYYSNSSNANKVKSGFVIYSPSSSVAGQYASDNSITCETTVIPTLKKTTYELGGITANWSAMPGATGYRVYRKESATDGYSIVCEYTDGTSYQDLTAENYKDYYYAVRPYFTYDGKNYWGGYLEEGVRGYRIDKPQVEQPVYSEQAVSVKWSAVAEADGYRLYRVEHATDTWTKLLEYTQDTEYEDTTAEFGKMYRYVVRGYKTVDGKTHWGDFDEGQYAYRINSTTLTATSSGLNSITLKWQKISAVTGYVLERSDDGETFTEITSLKGASKVTYTDSDVAAGRKYYYRTRAYKYTSTGNQYGLYSSVDSATPVPNKVSGFKVTSTKKGRVDFSWTKHAGVTGYVLYEKGSDGTWTRIATLKKAGTVSYSLSGLKSKKKHTYRLRAYKYANGKNNYGAYTSSVTVTVK